MSPSVRAAWLTRRLLSAAAMAVCVLVSLPPPAGGAPGDLDPSFGSGGRLTIAVGPRHANINAAVTQPDGKLVVAGFAEQSATPPYNRDFLVARLNPSGSLDTSFNATGSRPGVVTTPVGPGAADDAALGLALGPAGRIYAVGTTDPPAELADLAIVRYTSTGAVDPGFSTDGIQTHTTGSVEAAAAAGVQPDGRLVLAGLHGGSEGGMLVARIDSVTGALDPTFNAGGPMPGVNEVVLTPGFGIDRASALVLRGDGRIVVAGTANLSSADDDVALAQVRGDGTLDTTGFGGGTGMVRAGPAKDQGRALTLAPGGKLIVSGGSSPGGATIDFLLARLNGDGSPDASFSGDGVVTTAVPAADGTRFAGASAVAVQSDGKLLSAGNAFTCNGVGCADFAATRHNPDGTLDTSFGDGGKRTYDIAGANDFATAALQGSLVVFGVSFDGARERLAAARILTDPSVIDTNGPPPPPGPPAATAALR